jgi:hypothetical protein
MPPPVLLRVAKQSSIPPQHNFAVYHWGMRLLRDPVSATKYGANAEDPERQRARAM